jgi:16S rRNA (cytosine1402-N4)-methyltransferase
MNHITHTPVMLRETIDLLQVKPGKTYLDATIGMGGHAREMLKKGGRVIGLDQDQQAWKFSPKRFNRNFQIYSPLSMATFPI